MKQPPLFSILMPSTVSFNYRGAARSRPGKLRRAIRSVTLQTFKDWELIIVADGCQMTVDIAGEFEDERIKVKYIDKQPLWSGIPRNVAKFHATGRFCLYLDNDDMFKDDHLEFIATAIAAADRPLQWCYFNDVIWSKAKGWHVQYANLNELGRCGTSNICHLRQLPVEWDVNGDYAHDKAFIELLKPIPGGAYIGNGSYYVCHQPPNVQNMGYDL